MLDEAKLKRHRVVSSAEVSPRSSDVRVGSGIEAVRAESHPRIGSNRPEMEKTWSASPRCPRRYRRAVRGGTEIVGTGGAVKALSAFENLAGQGDAERVSDSVNLLLRPV